MTYFGTDGIRKNAEFFTADFLKKFARAIIKVFGKGEYILARDTRVSGEEIVHTLALCLNEAGASATVLGITPTPVLAHYARTHAAQAGIMISASHNPPQDNGLKVFDGEGYKISSAVEEQIESYFDSSVDKAEPRGRTVYKTDANREYMDYLTDKLSPSLGGISVALDTANGATAVVAGQLFNSLGCKVFIINDDTSGHNINKDCGAIYPEALERFMDSINAQLGFSFDGDGDRVVCRIGKVTLNGDHVLQILGEELNSAGMLANNEIVGTVMSNMGLERALAAKGINLRRVAVGDKNVLEYMKSKGCVLGGEQSGHIIITLYENTGDGLLTALMITKLYCEGKINFDNLFKDCPQILTSVRLPEGCKVKIEASDLISPAEAARQKVNVVIRKSGTEPIVRVMVQGESEETVARLSEELTKKTKELVWKEK
jgi:phosphoglucosamine mutase